MKTSLSNNPLDNLMDTLKELGEEITTGNNEALSDLWVYHAQPAIAKVAAQPMQQARDYLEKLYLDFRNNYLTVEIFAEHNGLCPAHAEELLTVARAVFDSPHPDM